MTDASGGTDLDRVDELGGLPAPRPSDVDVLALLGDDEAAAGPAWAPAALTLTVQWLAGSYSSDRTRAAYATDLGVPRRFHSWAPPPAARAAGAGPLRQSLFAWCAQHGVDPFTGMDHDRLRAWLAHAAACGDSDSTRGRRMAAVGAWYDAMRRRGHTAIVIGDLMTTRDRRRLRLHHASPQSPTVALTLAQLRALLLAAAHDRTAVGSRNHALAAVLATTGIRVRELCELDIDDVHRVGPSGHPALRIRGKGGEWRWVRLPDHELRLIDAYLPDRVEAVGGGRDVAPAGVVSSGAAARRPLFTTYRGRRLARQTVVDALRRLCTLLDGSDRDELRRAADVLAPLASTLHPHQFRHSYAQHAEAAGTPVSQVQRDLGHAALTTTQTYLEGAATVAASAATVMSGLLHVD